MHEENYASRFKYSARRLKKKGVCLFQAQKIYAIQEPSRNFIQSVPYLKSFPCGHQPFGGQQRRRDVYSILSFFKQ